MLVSVQVCLDALCVVVNDVCYVCELCRMCCVCVGSDFVYVCLCFSRLYVLMLLKGILVGSGCDSDCVCVRCLCSVFVLCCE